MKVMAQMSMVFNLDKCLGCHTCSIACKNLWTNRKGAEYMWWNNVESKPGIGYPKQWEKQERYQGGWLRGKRRKNAKPKLRVASRLVEMLNLFFNPIMPTMDEYMSHPVTFTYEDLHTPVPQEHQPVARPKSMVTGQEDHQLTWGVNWEDNGAGTFRTGVDDVNFNGFSTDERDALLSYQQVFMFYLPRICNHCLNPGCIAACPSGAAYKREEDGIVLIDQEVCRGWRYCVSACPYKKTYFNWTSGKMEKCILCYPRAEGGQAPACFHSCPGKIRYFGVIFYDQERVLDAVNVNDADLVKSQRSLILDPFDPEVIAAAKAAGFPDDWIRAAQRSPVYKFVKQWEIALPLHPEFRTLPSLFYIPPESPMQILLNKRGYQYAKGEGIPKLEEFRVPIKYLANLLSGGNEGEVVRALAKLVALRRYNRSVQVDGEPDLDILDQAGMTEQDAKEMYRLLTLAFYNERFVIPTTHREKAVEPYVERGLVGFPSPTQAR